MERVLTWQVVSSSNLEGQQFSLLVRFKYCACEEGWAEKNGQAKTVGVHHGCVGVWEVELL